MLQYTVSLDNLTLIGYPNTFTLNVLQNNPMVEKAWVTPNQRYHYNFSLIGGGFIQVKHETEWGGAGKVGKKLYAKVFKPGQGYEKKFLGFAEPKKTKMKPIYAPRLQPGWRKGSVAVIDWEEVTDRLTSGKPMRLEFNPNKYRSKGGSEKALLEIIKTMSDVHFSRRDVALDIFDHDLKDFMIIDDRGRKITEYKDGSRRLETIYFGSRESDEQLRIYDKAIEQKTEDGRKWWRIEGQMRGDSAKEMFTNPFRKVRIVRKSDYKHLPLKERAILLLLQADPDSMAELSKNSRTKYKKLLEEDVTEVSIQPDEIFKKHVLDLKGDAESWITFSNPWKEAGEEKTWEPQKDFSLSILKDGTPEDEYGNPLPIPKDLKDEILENVKKWVSN